MVQAKCLTDNGSGTGVPPVCSVPDKTTVGLKLTGGAPVPLRRRFDNDPVGVVLLLGMTNGSTTVSVKIPARILERIPAPGNGRSRFIVRALEKEIERQRPTEWKPTTKRGRMFAKILKAGEKERGPRLSEEEFERELRERRGRNF